MTVIQRRVALAFIAAVTVLLAFNAYLAMNPIEVTAIDGTVYGEWGEGGWVKGVDEMVTAVVVVGSLWMGFRALSRRMASAKKR